MDNKKTANRKDVSIICANCGKKFTFTVGEQLYYKERGLKFPKRCKGCRKHKFRSKDLVTIPKAVPVNSHYFPPKVMEKNEKTGGSSGEKHDPNVGRTCGECSISNIDKCPKPIHKNGDSACELFVSNEILTEEMIENFPKQGKATQIKFGKEGQTQFKRSKRESE